MIAAILQGLSKIISMLFDMYIIDYSGFHVSFGAFIVFGLVISAGIALLVPWDGDDDEED